MACCQSVEVLPSLPTHTLRLLSHMVRPLYMVGAVVTYSNLQWQQGTTTAGDAGGYADADAHADARCCRARSY